MSIDPAEGIHPPFQRIGCPDEYTVVIHYRGGPAAGGVVAVLTDPVSVEWTRSLDKPSTCHVRMSKPVCGALAAALDATVVDRPEWAYELTVYRGESDQPVWCGPFISYSETRDYLDLHAEDFLAWLKVLPIPVDFRFTGKAAMDATELAFWLISNALQQSDPNLLTYVRTAPAGIQASRRGQAWTEAAWTGVESLARDHIDICCVNRTILIGPEGGGSLAGRVLRFAEQDFTGEGPTIESDGYAAATMTTAKAQGLQGVATEVSKNTWGEQWSIPYPQNEVTSPDSSNKANVATIGKIEEGWRGLVWQLTALSGTRLTPEVTATAQRAYQRAKVPEFLRMSNAALSSRAPVAIEELIPGSRLTIALDDTWLRPVNTPMRLTDVHVVFDLSGESVQISAEPVSIRVADPVDEQKDQEEQEG
ncbi:hypothetical protein RCO28_37975 [Streptomyces sp. LHD-70]|uniref:hypothetical protein n=1 Tax=Streptomyces sp. LHD-70 TaxID=3072140 RepID=UPI00280D4090|nr:hypothetical protein [Streptomyces sp. LHD-70]MDQ8708207.1 hypothetical protein [Streptomyces sp. LHD-70]